MGMAIEFFGPFLRAIGISADVWTLWDAFLKGDWRRLLEVGLIAMIGAAIAIWMLWLWVAWFIRHTRRRENGTAISSPSKWTILVGFLGALIIAQNAIAIKPTNETTKTDYRGDSLCFDSVVNLDDKTKENILIWFAKARKNNPKLGAQTKPCLESVNAASKVVFEHANALWIDDPRQFFVIDHATNKWNLIKEEDTCDREPWCKDSGPNSIGRQAAISHFQRGEPPVGFFYPDFGMASYLTNHPGEWSHFGWLKEDCQLRGGIIFRLDFQNGYILGPYPIRHNDQSGQIEVLFENDRTVDSIFLGQESGPKCTNGSIY